MLSQGGTFELALVCFPVMTVVLLLSYPIRSKIDYVKYKKKNFIVKSHPGEVHVQLYVIVWICFIKLRHPVGGALYSNPAL